MQQTFISKARCSVALASLAVSTFAFSSAAQAEYPDRPVRIVVGFSAGGTTDVIARIIAKELTEELGQTFVVENKPGAGSNIAADMVARSKNDGYTLNFMAVTSTINQTLYKNLNFDVIKDFAPIAMGAIVPNILVVNPKVPAKTVQELVAYAKANPGKMAFASSGSGTSIHMAGEMFKMQAGIDVLHVPYKGSAPAITDLIGGQVDYDFDNMPSALPHVQSGKLRALAVTTKERSPSAPDVPTMMESGFPDFDVSSWFGLTAPAGTPPEILEKLNAAVVKAQDSAALKHTYQQIGAEGSKMTQAEFAKFVNDEVQKWAPVVKASGASVD